MKISLMIASAVAFMILQASSPQVIMVLFHDIWRWYGASDIFLYSETSFLNEVPMAEFLDQYTSGENPDVISYQFTGKAMDVVVTGEIDSLNQQIFDLSEVNQFSVRLYGVSDTYYDASYK